MSSIRKIVGKNIRLFRKAKGLTQERLAELVNVSSSYIGYLERGLRSPSLDLLERIGTTLEVDPVVFLNTTTITDDTASIQKRFDALLVGKHQKPLQFLYEVAVAYFASIE